MLETSIFKVLNCYPETGPFNSTNKMKGKCMRGWEAEHIFSLIDRLIDNLDR